MWQTLGPWEQEADGEIVLFSSGLTPALPGPRLICHLYGFLDPWSCQLKHQSHLATANLQLHP